MMIDAAITPLKEHFSSLDDPRAQHRIEHLLLDIVLVTICGVICGADTWVEIEHYGIAKQGWLKTFLELPDGIPSHDTFERMFARLHSEQLQQCFLNWVQAVFNITDCICSTIAAKISSAVVRCRKSRTVNDSQKMRPMQPELLRQATFAPYASSSSGYCQLNQRCQN
jgi:hypothetical protein